MNDFHGKNTKNSSRGGIVTTLPQSEEMMNKFPVFPYFCG
jgi:hypothetical protein